MEYGKSTYRQIIDDVLADVNADEALARKTEASFINDILRAEQIICQEYSIEEEYRLRLSADVAEYSVQDRPAITGITAATPPVVTSASHGLSDGDVINIREVQGITGINGRRQITYIGANLFSLKEFQRIDGITYDSSTTTATVTTEEVHGWSTGNTITLANTGDAGLNGSVVITVTGVKTFTYTPLGEPVSYSYSGGATATKNATGTGTWTSGGRYWKEGEIPTHLWNFRYGIREYNGFTRKIEFIGSGNLVEMQDVNWGQFVYSAYYAPTSAVHLRKMGMRYIQFYPPPQQDQYVTIYGVLRITPNLYFGDPTTAVIHLDSEHDMLIKSFLKAQCYQHMKMRKEYSEELAMFYGEIKKKQMYRQVRHKIQVTYR